jgi:hypothetical protein
MLATVLKLSPENRLNQGVVWIPKLTQLTEECAKTITTGRYYMTALSREGYYKFDPRYLVFEFVWNIQLRRKQVEIVNDFRENIANGRSKVKQMIMGAGKTTVVGPLLAMLLANKSTLIFEVVPPALLDFSAGILRERFSAGIRKPVFTFSFDRYSTVTPMLLSKLQTVITTSYYYSCIFSISGFGILLGAQLKSCGGLNAILCEVIHAEVSRNMPQSE